MKKIAGLIPKVITGESVQEEEPILATILVVWLFLRDKVT
jgi:hypothetical protein